MSFKCYLDCDGVLADFIGGICRKFGVSESEIYATTRPRPLPVDLTLLIGIPTQQIWQALDADFWANLEVYPWAQRLVREIDSMFNGNVVLCTSPGYLSLEHGAAGALVGKEQWIMKNFPQFQKRYVFTYDKQYIASPWHVLIDDQDQNCKKFIDAGGFGIVFPQRWNSRYQHLERNTEGDSVLSVVLSDAEFFSSSIITS